MEAGYLQARSSSVKVESGNESVRYPITMAMKVMTAVAPNDTSTPIPATSGSLSIGWSVDVQLTMEAQLPIL